MILQVTVRDGCRWRTVTAFGGVLIERGQWVNVPTGHDDEARRHQMLTVRTVTPPAEKEPPPTQKAAADYSGLSTSELRKAAKAAGVDGYATMKKSELRAALENK